MHNRISNYKMSTISIAIVAATLLSKRPPPPPSNPITDTNTNTNTKKIPSYIRAYH